MIKEISKDIALNMIKKYHYSNTLPKINKYFLGYYLNDELVGVITLGYGTRPKHTIKRIFPSLDTKNYLEIGRMCMTDDMPRNSESKMLSELEKWIKINLSDIKILFTWADGMQGKCGYVYQASNYIYCGYAVGEMYVMDNVKIHVRQIKKILCEDYKNEKRITVRPTNKQMIEHNIRYYKGKQFRYLRFLCSKSEKRKLLKEVNDEFNLPYPKTEDITFSVRNPYNGKWEPCNQPLILTDDINEVK